MKFCLRFIVVLFCCPLSLAAQIKLKSTDFASRLEGQADIQLIDVRTPEEFKEGHLKNALNINFKDSAAFEAKLESLARNKPVMVYCLGGSRSEAAARLLADKGFTEVYDLEGGYMNWTAEKRPVDGVKEAPVVGMTASEYDTLIRSDIPVLVDFTAKWCAPCKVMYPSIKKMESEFKGKAVVKVIDIDKHPSITEHLGIRYLPLVYVYKNGEIVWKATGVVSESKLREVLSQQL